MQYLSCHFHIFHVLVALQDKFQVLLFICWILKLLILNFVFIKQDSDFKIQIPFQSHDSSAVCAMLPVCEFES